MFHRSLSNIKSKSNDFQIETFLTVVKHIAYNALQAHWMPAVKTKFRVALFKISRVMFKSQCDNKQKHNANLKELCVTKFTLRIIYIIVEFFLFFMAWVLDRKHPILALYVFIAIILKLVFLDYSTV